MTTTQTNKGLKPTWKKPSYSDNPLYQRSLNVDLVTGKPLDYLSCFSAYHRVAVEIARKLGIPAQDVTDAIQEVNLRFYRKDGINWYDPNKEFNHSDGKTRRSKFFPMYQRWLYLSLLAERDKYLKRISRSVVVEDTLFPENQVPDISKEIESQDLAINWAQTARDKLIESGNQSLINVFDLCLQYAEDNTQPTYKELAEQLGCSIKTAATRVQKLRKVLTSVGMGVESLYEQR